MDLNERLDIAQVKKMELKDVIAEIGVADPDLAEEVNEKVNALLGALYDLFNLDEILREE